MTHNIKPWRTALLMGLIITLLLQSTLLAQQCNGIRDKVLRLHILANSDSTQDQHLKYLVRDALLTQGGHILQGAHTKEQAIARLQEHLPELTRIARQTLIEQGDDSAVTCTVQPTYFATRTYETVTLPAGNYTALRVVIGEGNGQNWWCIMFPNLCIPAAAESPPTESYFTAGQTDLMEHGQRYQVKFKAVEWFQAAADQIKRWF